MADKILRRPAVEEMVGLSTSTIYAMMAENPPSFPKPINLAKRAVGWTESSINAWLKSKICEAAKQQALSDDYYARRAIFPICQNAEVIE